MKQGSVFLSRQTVVQTLDAEAGECTADAVVVYRLERQLLFADALVVSKVSKRCFLASAGLRCVSSGIIDLQTVLHVYAQMLTDMAGVEELNSLEG